MSEAASLERAALEVIRTRRAVRDYKPGALDESTIRKLLDCAVRAPTAIHEEAWAFAVVQDPAVLKRISDRAKGMATEEFAKHRVLLKTPEGSSEERLASLLASPGFNIFYNASTLIVICAKPKSQFVTADCWLAAENLMLAACAMGLGSCPIGFAIPALNAPDVKNELRIPAEVTAVAPLIVGVPRGPTPEVPRKPPEILCWVR